MNLSYGAPILPVQVFHMVGNIGKYKATSYFILLVYFTTILQIHKLQRS